MNSVDESDRENSVELETTASTMNEDDEDHSYSPMKCVEKIFARVTFDKRNSFETNSSSVPIGRDEDDVNAINSDEED